MDIINAATPAVAHESAFALGDMVRERLSGVEGRVTGITFWETSCTHIGVKRLGLDKEGKPYELLWFDEVNCEPLAQRPELAPAPGKKPGGPLSSGNVHASR